MTVGQVTARTRVLAADHNSLVNLLQGASSETLAFLLRVAASNNFTIVLSDAAGARKFSIKDSAEVEIFSVDSDGNVANSGTYTPTTLILPQAAAPAPTAEGDARWDTNDNRLVVGDGAATQTFYPGDPRLRYKYKTASQDFTSTSLGNITATSGNIAFAVAANTDYEINIDIFLSAVGTVGSGGLALAFTLPTAPTAAYATYEHPYSVSDLDSAVNVRQRQYGTTGGGGAVTSGSTFLSQPAADTAVGGAAGLYAGFVRVRLLLRNGANAGTVTLQGAQNTAAGTTTIAGIIASSRIVVAE